MESLGQSPRSIGIARASQVVPPVAQVDRAQPVFLGAQVAVWVADSSHHDAKSSSQAPHVARLIAQLTARVRQDARPTSSNFDIDA